MQPDNRSRHFNTVASKHLSTLPRVSCVGSSYYLPLMWVLSFQQVIMKDKWMNIGYEDDELKPYLEPETDFGDSKRIGIVLSCILQLLLMRPQLLTTPSLGAFVCASGVHSVQLLGRLPVNWNYTASCSVLV